MSILTICWQAIAAILGVIAFISILILMVTWAAEVRWSWRKIVGTVVLSSLMIVLLYGIYNGLSTIFCA